MTPVNSRNLKSVNEIDPMRRSLDNDSVTSNLLGGNPILKPTYQKRLFSPKDRLPRLLSPQPQADTGGHFINDAKPEC